MDWNSCGLVLLRETILNEAAQKSRRATDRESIGADRADIRLGDPGQSLEDINNDPILL